MPDAWLGESLLYVLRERLGLPGSKAGCEQGECGSCSVIIDGALECACLVLAAAAVGCEITTVEGLQPDRGDFTPIQEAFLAEGAVQCGFCTPGLVVAMTTCWPATPTRATWRSGRPSRATCAAAPATAASWPQPQRARPPRGPRPATAT